MGFRLQRLGLVHANGLRALAGVTLAARRGERIAVIGPSGAGKTTLLRLLGTAVRPSEGRVEVLESNPWQLSGGALRRLRTRIGTVHQAPPLPARQRVITAVLAGRLGTWPWWKSLLSLAYPADIAGACAQLARLDLADRLFDRCDRLSGGQLQRVGIARVLYQQPELILADLAIQQLIAEATGRGVTLIASLHAVDLALRWFPRIVGLRAGEVAFDLPPVRITDALLRDLYASESATLPTQGGEPLRLPQPGAEVAVRRPACQ
ncbi:MAG: ATP-binding cassette domain-containing protein [Pseudomonadota bacterium]